MICKFDSDGLHPMISVSAPILPFELLRAADMHLKAIWDNRSVFHAATFDYFGLGERFGNRAVGLGERPYLDPNSTSRREALGHVQA